MEVLINDMVFTDSPDAGSKECICSRCRGHITADEVPIRIWTEGEEDPDACEYRYCEHCQDTEWMITGKPQLIRPFNFRTIDY